jgi:urease accessory protein
MAITTTDNALLRLLQLSSAALPVGGYAFSQGLEFAIDEGWLKNPDDIAQWLTLQMSESQAAVDLPLLQRQLIAASSGDGEQLAYWNTYALACRETAELRLTDTAMGAALLRLLASLEVALPLAEGKETSFVTAFAMAAAHWQLDARSCCHGYLWSWLENQVAAATKLVPLGQTAAQQLLSQLLLEIPPAIDKSMLIHDHAIGASLPAVAMASARHETQYSRLFRS